MKHYWKLLLVYKSNASHLICHFDELAFLWEVGGVGLGWGGVTDNVVPVAGVT